MENVFGAIIPVLIVLSVLYRVFGGARRRNRDQSEQRQQPQAEMRRQSQAGPEGLRDQLRRRAEALRQERLGGLRGRAGGAGAGAQGRARESLESPWSEETEASLSTLSNLPSGEVIYGRPEPEEAPPAPVAEDPPLLTPSRPSQARRRLGLRGLASRQGLRQALVAREVLGPPRGLQSPDEDQSSR